MIFSNWNLVLEFIILPFIVQKSVTKKSALIPKRISTNQPLSYVRVSPIQLLS